MAKAPEEESAFNLWIKQRRRALDLTQEDLAECVGCSKVAIQKIELGERRPSKQVALRLAECLKIPADQHEAFVSFARGEEHVAQWPAGSAKWPAAIPLPATPNNLPTPLTPLVGREDALQAAHNYLLRHDIRLLTVTGVPGVGKTRLSLDVAAQLLPDFYDGVFFVELAPISEPELVPSTVATTLGCEDIGGGSHLDWLKQFIRGQRILLVLDNFEQILDAAPFVAHLLGACPALKVLVTSREALHIIGEQQFPLQPLDVPDLTHLPDPEDDKALLSYPAVELFVQRASAVDPSFALTEANYRIIAAICSRLEGLPLAIELAAARIRMLTPEDLFSRLDQRLTLLTGGSRHLPARLQTLRGAIDWSYNLLNQDEKKLFRRLGVFQGGRSLDAIEAVCNPEGSSGISMLDGVSSLVDKGLLRREEGTGGAPRFMMLEMIHEYAREKLEESAEADALQREHALYFMRLAEEAELQLVGKKQAEWYNRLEEEHDNLRAALRWERETESIEDVDMGLRTASALFQFWQARGYFSEGREQLEALLSKVDIVDHSDRGNVRAETVPRIKVLNVIGMLAWRQGDYPAARSALEEALAIGRKLGRKDEMAFSLIHLGAVAYSEGDYSTTRTLQEESLALWRATGNTAGIASSLSNLGLLAYRERDYPRARSLFEQSLAMRREIGNARGIAASLSDLGFVAYDEGDYPTARSLFEEALTIDRELGNKLGISIVLTGLGLVVCREGAYSKVHPLNEDLTLRREIGDKKGNGESAGGQAEEVSGIGVVANAPERVEGAGRAEHIKQGVRLLGAVEGLLVSIGGELEPAERTPYEQGIASARSQLGEEAFEKAMQEGRAMSIEEAIAYALGES